MPVASARCFLLEPTSRYRRMLRRHVSTSDGAPVCPGYTSRSDWSYHDASVFLDQIIPEKEGDAASGENLWPADDPRWPTHCRMCGWAFRDEDPRQLFVERIYYVSKTAAGLPAGPDGAVALGAEMSLRDGYGIPGAMWFADWYIDQQEQWDRSRPWAWWAGPDGHCIQCVTPGGSWIIDSRAANCGSPEDNEHSCWVRHGEAPDLTVDKNGPTCAAGGGSIQSGGWHGSLRAGVLAP